MKFIKLFPFELIADTLVERECIYINVEKIVSVEVYSNAFEEFRNAFEINNPRHEVLYCKAKNLNDILTLLTEVAIRLSMTA